MWQFFTLVLIIVMIIQLFANRQREQSILHKLKRTLKTAGDTRAEPTSVDAALDRLANHVHSDASDEMPRRVEASFDAMTTAAIVVDADGAEIMRNAQAKPYLHGRHGDALIESVIQARLHDALLGQATDEELRLHGPPEQVLLVVGTPLVESGELLGAVVLVDDVSEQHHLDKVRRDFVANVSHELRTPVGALSLLAETLEGEQDPEIVATFLRRIQSETSRLGGLIEDLLDLSRIEDGAEFDTTQVDVSALLDECIDALRSNAEHRSIELRLDSDAEAAVLVGDRRQLTSAFTNLLANAIKYTEPGGTVSARIASHGDEISIAVEDTGIGVPQQDIHRVFERFYRADKSRASDTGGTGLGLSIVRNVAVNHGGRVELVSQEGVGSTFSMILPVAGSDVAVPAVVYSEMDD